jgi:hypothetical protein
VTSPHPSDAGAFADLLAEVASAIAQSVPPWRVRLGEAVARWQAEGVRTTILERALQLDGAPDVDGLLATFDAAVSRLRALERRAARLDATAAGGSAFRDPARLREAEALVARLERAARPETARAPTPDGDAASSRPRTADAPRHDAPNHDAPVPPGEATPSTAAAVVSPRPTLIRPDAECWVLAWPDVTALLIED